jgi:hypothetical protein
LPTDGISSTNSSAPSPVAILKAVNIAATINKI